MRFDLALLNLERDLALVLLQLHRDFALDLLQHDCRVGRGRLVGLFDQRGKLFVGDRRIVVIGVLEARAFRHFNSGLSDLRDELDCLGLEPHIRQPVGHADLTVQDQVEHGHVTVARAGPQPHVDRASHVIRPLLGLDGAELAILVAVLAFLHIAIAGRDFDRLFDVFLGEVAALVKELGPAQFRHVAGDQLNLRIACIPLVLAGRGRLVLKCLGVKCHRGAADACALGVLFVRIGQCHHQLVANERDHMRDDWVRALLLPQQATEAAIDQSVRVENRALFDFHLRQADSIDVIEQLAL